MFNRPTQYQLDYGKDEFRAMRSGKASGMKYKGTNGTKLRKGILSDFLVFRGVVHDKL